MNTLSLGLLKAGSILSNYSGIFLILVVLLVGLILFLSLSEKGHIYLRNAAYHLPVFRDIPLAADYGRLAQGLSLGLYPSDFHREELPSLLLKKCLNESAFQAVRKSY